MKLPRVGHERYLSTTPGIGGKLRYQPEDFRVTEMSLAPPPAQQGRYSIVRITARNHETNRLVYRMARQLGVRERDISFAGTKDKRAVTTQLFSFRAPAGRVAELDLPDVTVEPMGTANKPLKLGGLAGNAFTIVLRDVADDALARVAAIADELADGFPNYFGVQRFGSIRPITHLAGAALVRGDYRAAVEIYVADADPPPEAEGAEARRLAAAGDWAAALEWMPASLLFERQMAGHLSRHTDDYLGALRAIPRNLLRMFVHAFQSALFNRTIELRMARGLPVTTPVEGDLVLPIDEYGRPNPYEPIPVTPRNRAKLTLRCREGRAWVSGLLPGAQCDLAEGAQGEIEREVMREAEVGFRDFVLLELPEVTSRGLRRPLHQLANDFAWEAGGGGRGDGSEDGVGDAGDDGHSDGSLVFRFWLQKGTYATTLLREFMKSDDLTVY